MHYTPQKNDTIIQIVPTWKQKILNSQNRHFFAISTYQVILDEKFFQ